MKTDIFLTGLVSGLTILLGVITADWLKRLRDRINYTRRIAIDLSNDHNKFIEYLATHVVKQLDHETGSGSTRSNTEKDFIETFILLSRELLDVSESSKWPQRNARQLREAAINLRICLFANAEHCVDYQVFLHPANIEELRRLELAFRRSTRSKQTFEIMERGVSEKREELKRQMLSREAASS